MIFAGSTLCFHCVKRKSFMMVSSERSIVFYSSSKTVGKLVPRRQTESQSFYCSSEKSVPLRINSFLVYNFSQTS